jgi:signal transduction histidine kinase/CheY-like chemotaxis protein
MAAGDGTDQERAARARALAVARALLDHAGEALVAVAPTGRVEAWSRAATGLFGLSRAEALGGPLARIVPTAPRLLVGGPRRVEGRHADGRALPLEVRGAEVTLAEQRRVLLAFRAAGAPAARRRAAPPALVAGGTLAQGTLADEMGHRSAILSATSDGMLLVDPRGVVAYANRRFGELALVEVEELEGTSVGALAQALRERRPEPPQAFDRVLLATDRGRELPPARCVLGGRTLRVSMSPVHRDEGPLLGCLVVLRDVTVEEKVQRAKEELIGNVSHELRTPLTSIRGFVDLLRAGRAGPVTAKQKEFLDIIAQDVTRLTALVADLLEVDRVGQAPLATVRVDLVPILRDALAVEEGAAARKGLTLALEAPDALPVTGDPDRLRQAFGNLVSNAVKYTARGGVTLRARVLDGARVRVDVVDTGVGIRPEDRAQLFQRFFRADDPVVRAAGGTGLGLSIVKALVERHGGAIEVLSEPGRGSTFRVVLPGAPLAPGPAESPPAAAPALVPSPAPAERDAGACPRVVAIDPDPVRQRVYAAALREAGVEAIPAPDWSRAEEVAAEGAPDLVLLAARARDETGRWRPALDRRLAATPVVVVITPEEVGRALRAGVDGLVTTPLDAAALRSEVARVLALRRGARP